MPPRELQSASKNAGVAPWVTSRRAGRSPASSP
jgi:hypothetical protein